MKRLEPLLGRANEPDVATLDELRECSSFLATSEVLSIVRSALLNVGPYGQRRHISMLGPVLSGRPDREVMGVAAWLDQWDNRLERSRVLARILGSLGDVGTGVCAPFMERLSSDHYDASAIAGDLGGAFPNMPRSRCDKICGILLTKEAARTPDNSGYDNTLSMFLRLRHLSPQMQEAVFSKAKEIWDGIPAGPGGRNLMAFDFSVEYQYRDVVQACAPELRDKWIALLAT